MPQSNDPTSPKLPKGYTTVEPGSIEKAWIAAGKPYDSSDVIDRTKPQSLSSRMSEGWFDAKNKVSGLIDEAKRELVPQSAASSDIKVPAGYRSTNASDPNGAWNPNAPMYKNNPKPQPPSSAMDQAMKNAGMIPGSSAPASK